MVWLHHFTVQFEHQRMTIHAGVHLFAVPGRWISEHFHINRINGFDGQGNAGVLGSLAGFGCRKKRRFKGDPLNLDSQVTQHQTRQRAVQPPRA